MAKPAPMIPVSPKLYRHFAIATVAITACLAVFADGESRQEIEEIVAERQQQNELQAQDVAKHGRKQLAFKDKRKSKGSFGQEERMHVRTNFADVDVYEAEMGPRSIEEAERAGQLASLPPDVRKKLGLEEKKPNRAAIESIIAASKARSQTRTSF